MYPLVSRYLFALGSRLYRRGLLSAVALFVICSLGLRDSLEADPLYDPSISTVPSYVLACGNPDGLSVEILNTFTVRVVWNPVLGVSTYNVRYRVEGTTPWTDLTGLQTESQLINIGPTSYEWEVQAVCDGELSDWVRGPLLNAQCDLPTNLSVGTLSVTTAELIWSAEPTPAGSQLRYRVQGAGVWTTLSVGNTSTTTLSGLITNSTYEWEMRTDCGNGNVTEWVAGSTFTPVTNACPPPANLTVGVIRGTSAQPRWNGAAGAVGYQLRYRPVGSIVWTTLDLSGSLVLLTLQNLTLTTQYEWEIRTDCGGNFSPWAAGPNFTTDCTNPSGHTVTSITDTSAIFAWDVIDGAQEYILRYRVNAGSTWTFQNLSENSFEVTTLTPSTNYEWQVSTGCSNGTSDFVPGPFFETLGEECPGPNALVATNVTFTTVDVSWDPAPGISDYELRYRITGSGPWAVFLTVNGTSLTVTGLDTFSNYEWQVRTLCPNSESDWKAGPFFRTLGPDCEAPSNLAVSGTSTSSAALTWQGVPEEDSYEVRYRVTGTGPWTTTQVEDPRTILTGLIGNTNYEWQVRTLCEQSASDWVAGSFFTTQESNCANPFNLESTITTATTASFSWEAAPGVFGFNFRYRIQGSPIWTTVQTDSNFVSLGGLITGSEYEWQVQTNCGTGTSGWIAGLNFTAGATPCPDPINPTVGNVTDASAGASWDAVSGALGYELRYRVINTSTWTVVSVPSTTYDFADLVEETTYEWQVRTTCEFNSSEWVAGPNFETEATPCPAPTNLATSELTSTGVQLNWTAAAGASGYDLRYRIEGTTVWTVLSTTEVTSTLASLSPNTQYEWQVRSDCGDLQSEYVTGPIFQTPLVTCVAPSNLQITSLLSEAAVIAWDSVAGAVDYLVRYRLVGSTSWITNSVGSTSFTLEGLAAESSYEWEVQTRCEGNVSEWVPGEVIQTLQTCPVPTNPTVLNITSLTAEIRWEAPSPITGITYSYNYRYRPVGETEWTTESKEVTSHILSKLLSETTYEWQIQTDCGGGNTSEWVSGPNFTTDIAPCEEPLGLRVFNVAQDSASFSWNSIPNAEEYQFRYREAASDLWIILTVQDTTLTLFNLIVATPYNWSVRADCGENLSEWAEGDNFSTESVPCEPPSELTVDSVSNTMAYVSWTGYIDATLYRVRYRVVDTEVWTTIETADLSAVFSNLLANTEYQWAAQSECGSVPTEWVLGPNFITEENPDPCDPPSGLEVVGVTEIQANLRWAQVAGVDSFRVRYRIQGSTQWQVVFAPDTLVTLDNLTDGSIYQWEVQSICGDLLSSWTRGVDFTTVDIPEECGLPADLTVVEVGSQSASLAWTGVLLAPTYQVRYTLNSQSAWDTATVSISAAELNGLQSFETYEWEVRSLCNNDTSAWVSGPAFTTQARPFVELLQPADSTFIPEGGSAILEALASDADSDSLSIAIYANDSIIIEDDTPLLGFQWEDIPQGLYRIYAIATDSDGNRDTSEVSRLFVGFDVENLLVSDFVTFGSELCFLDSAQVIIGDASIGAVSYEWNFGEDAFPSTADSAGPHVIKYASSGIKNIQLLVKDSLGNENIRIKSIEVFIKPPVGNGGIDKFLCDGEDSVLLVATGSSEFGGTWRLAAGSGEIVNPNSPETWVRNIDSEENIFFWELSNGICVSDPDTVRVIAGSCIPTLTGELVGSDTLCVFDIGTTYSVEEDDLVDEYIWSLPPGIEGNVNGNSVTITQISGGGGLITVYAQNEFGRSATLGRDIIVADCSNEFRIITFTAYEEGEGVIVDWVAENEGEILSYTVQRSLDSVDFVQVASLSPLEDTENRHRYLQPDEISTGGGVYYYRIRIQTKDGQISYSRVVKLELNGLESLISFVIAPNPIAENTVTLQVEVLRPGFLDVEMIDRVGRAVFVDSRLVNTGRNTLAFPGHNLTSGVYFMRIQKAGNGKSEVIKFIKR